MVLKIRNKNTVKDAISYKGAKKILTPRDIREADRFDVALEKEIKNIERILIKAKMLSPQARKSDMLRVWHLIGIRINMFLKEHKVSKSEEGLFWDQLYGRSSLINRTVPKNKISETRNDFRIASLLAHYPLKKLQRTGLWALWREILTYKSFKDKRVMDWVVQKIEQISPKTRNEARPLLKAVAARLKRIDTTVLSDKELLEKLRGIEKQKS
jgi:hypothetical protein